MLQLHILGTQDSQTQKASIKLITIIMMARDIRTGGVNAQTIASFIYRLCSFLRRKPSGEDREEDKLLLYKCYYSKHLNPRGE